MSGRLETSAKVSGISVRKLFKVKSEKYHGKKYLILVCITALAEMLYF